MRIFCSLLTVILLISTAATAGSHAAVKHATELAVGVPAIPFFSGEDSGSLKADGGKVSFPLKHTEVAANVAGHVVRVAVKQVFGNPSADRLEAIYTFPLSQSAAVDDMIMKVGSRTIHGTIKKKEEARKIYEQAKTQGHTAALLDQERPNIFTQSVANVPPHQDVEVTLSYVDLLPYEAGKYTFAFPTVVGPRFIPGLPNRGQQQRGTVHDTAQVPDASKITPPILPPKERDGHDISIAVNIDSPVPISSVDSVSHAVTASKVDARHFKVALQSKATLPNKDFVLTWNVADTAVRSGYLATANDDQGYFNLSIIPPKRPSASQIQPKEMVFLIDCSGSQSGRPIEKAKEVMRYCVDHMNANDTFQIITFNNTVVYLFDKPQPSNSQNRAKAQRFLDQLTARGGTWMAPAVEGACAIPTDEHRLRIVSFMTDGYVGNDFQIISLIKKLRNTSRWFPFGTGNSVNRFLIDNIAKEGGGEPDYVYLNSSAQEVGKKFYDKISSPVLTDVKVDFGGLNVKEVFPKEVSDVWAEKPLYYTGRFNSAGKGTVTISGFSGGKPYTQKLDVVFPHSEKANGSLASIWARAKVDYLMQQNWFEHQGSTPNGELVDEITRVGLEHHIMTQYTSFVAVEEQATVKEGKSATVEVPVELPEGVSPEFIIPTDGERSRSVQLQGSQFGQYRLGGFAGTNSYYPAPAMSPVMAKPASMVSEGAGFNSGSTDRGPQKVRATAPLKANLNAQTNAPINRMGFDMVYGQPVQFNSLKKQSGLFGGVTGNSGPYALNLGGGTLGTGIGSYIEHGTVLSDEEVKSLAERILSKSLAEWFYATDAKAADTKTVKVTFDSATHTNLGHRPGMTVLKHVFESPDVIVNVNRDALRGLLQVKEIKAIEEVTL
jgi:Ca-activated chloride channel family protein